MTTQSETPFDSSTFGNTLSLRVDGDIGAMSLAPNGRDAVLAGRSGLYVIDLDDPFSEPRWIHHVTSWEVADVQWSPHRSKPSWCVSTSNQKLMVWDLARPSQNAIEHVLHGHGRAVTDINFHPQDPELLALCSVDTFVSVWDLRTPRRPAVQLADWRAGLSQVKWNYINPYTLASAHDNYFYIWDTRKGAVPVHKIELHTRRINGLDFGRLYEHEIISCSHDLSVKFWNYAKSTEVPTLTINTDFPVNRARHLPFGEYTCGIMPTSGGNNSVYIVNYKDQQGVSKLKSSYVFKGHSEPVKDFLWRQRHSADAQADDREFQLVTWSKDCDLRLWPLTEDFYEKAGFERNRPLDAGKTLPGYNYRTYREEPLATVENDDEIVSAIAKTLSQGQFVSYKGGSTGGTHSNLSKQLSWISGVRIGRSLVASAASRNIFEAGTDNGTGNIANFGEEVSLVGHKFPKIRFEKISVSTGTLILSLMGPWSADLSDEHKDDLVFLRVEAVFPRNYPAAEALPQFSIEDNHELSKEKKLEIALGLLEITAKYHAGLRFCLEPCLRYLMGEKVDLGDVDGDALMLDPYEIPYDEGEQLYGFSDSSEEVSAASSDSEDELIPLEPSTLAAKGDKIDYGFDSTPVPKGCGAIWTHSGHLVCFFISEAEKPKSTLLKFDQQGFGLTGALAKTRKTAAKSKKYSRLDDSDDSDSGMSEDSFSDDWADILQDDVPRLSRFLKNNVGMRQYAMGHNRPSTNTNVLSVPTALSLATHSTRLGSGPARVKNKITIFDFRYLIPAKMELAFEYRILGDSPELLARHNSFIAEKYGYREIADLWKLLSVVLTKDVDIDDDEDDLISPSVNMFFRDTLYGAEGSNFNLHNFRYYWGSHPFGGRWFARKLLDYYEKKRDIQMLLMLSCILFENSDHKDDPNVSIHSPYKKAGGNNVRNTVAFTISDGLPSSSTGRLKLHPPRMSSFASSMSSFDQRSFRSGSPDRYNSYFKKKILSPYSSHRDSVAGEYPGSSVTQRSSYFHTPSVTSLRDDRNLSILSFQSLEMSSSFNSRALGPARGAPLAKPVLHQAPEVKIQITNEQALDLYDDTYSMSLLASLDQEKLKMYREEYASILYLWGLHASRVKVLKFNYPSNGNEPSPLGSEYDVHKGHIGYSDVMTRSIDPEDPLYASTTAKSEVCNYCGLVVAKRLFVCSRCAHILHAQCASEWWTQSEEIECPSGCGCHCLDYNLIV